MVENYMDYTNDACMDIFTADQKDRIRTVMLNSPRRALLPNSQKCGLPVPTVSFVVENGGTINEGTNCDYVDLPVDMQISLPPSDDAVVSFILAGNNTATQGVDFDIIPTNITFSAGSTSNQSFVLRIYNDAIIESNEIIELQIVVTTVGDAVSSSTAGIYTLTILDANFVASNILYEDFEGGEFIINDKKLDTPIGSIFTFGRNEMHEVKPVTKGTRYSLHFVVNKPKPKKTLL